MHLALIAAMSDAGVIGVNNQLPWHLPADLKHFKKLTLGKPILMGRKTYESIGKPLPERTNIVITNQRDFAPPGVLIAHTLAEALALTKGFDEIMIIGGANLFEQTLNIAKTLYLTYIHHDFNGDTYFPPIDATVWETIEKEDHKADAENPYPYTFVTLQRVR